jgi:hypothetical protein
LLGEERRGEEKRGLHSPLLVILILGVVAARRGEAL